MCISQDAGFAEAEIEMSLFRGTIARDSRAIIIIVIVILINYFILGTMDSLD